MRHSRRTISKASDQPQSAESAQRLLGSMERGDVVVKDTDGRDVRLGDVWREKPAVVVFVRHYG